MAKYIINIDWADGLTNKEYFDKYDSEYFDKYDCECFEAEDDKAAFEQAEKWQHEAEREVESDGKELNSLDPCLMMSIYRIELDEDGYEQQIKVEF